MMDDEVHWDNSEMDLVGEVNGLMDSTDAANMSDGVLDSKDAGRLDGGAFDSVGWSRKWNGGGRRGRDSNNSQDTRDMSVNDSHDGIGTGDDWNCDFSENYVSDENGLNDNDDDDGEDDDDKAILISSGDEGAVELSQLKTKTQKFVLRRRFKYLNVQIVSQAVSLEREYYEHNDKSK